MVLILGELLDVLVDVAVADSVLVEVAVEEEVAVAEAVPVAVAVEDAVADAVAVELEEDVGNSEAVIDTDSDTLTRGV